MRSMFDCDAVAEALLPMNSWPSFACQALGEQAKLAGPRIWFRARCRHQPRHVLRLAGLIRLGFTH
jgi:hypothetical protein